MHGRRLPNPKVIKSDNGVVLLYEYEIISQRRLKCIAKTCRHEQIGQVQVHG